MAQIFERVAPLTDDQRDSAMQRARMRIAGKEPVHADFVQRTQARLPLGVRRVINALAFSLLVFAFLPSAMRIHAVALETFALTIAHAPSAYVAALSVVMMAEIGLIIFSLAMAAVDDGHAWQRWAYALGALISACIALAGNAVAVGTHATANLFALLETFGPPVLTLIVAQVLKSQMLDTISARHTAHAAYTQALNDWRMRIEHAEQEAAWMRTYANALRDAFGDANKRRTAVMREISNDEWRMLINRELRADAWYVEAEERAQAEARAQDEAEQVIALQDTRMREHATSSGQRTGESQNAVYESADGWRVHACECGKTFGRAYPSQMSAQNAYSAHLRSTQHQAWADAREDAQLLVSENGHKRDGMR